ncbi:hypothetical protein [Streptomyces endocoffeicus]|nr:hypothetical protein [Streptomyces endocoffeicus]
MSVSIHVTDVTDVTDATDATDATDITDDHLGRRADPCRESGP